MRSYFAIFLLFLPFVKCYSQTQAITTDGKAVILNNDSTWEYQQEPPSRGPRRGGHFADKPGIYSLVIKQFTPIINRGDTLFFQVFFSGYGNIRKAKILMTPPAEIFDIGYSIATTDMKKILLEPNGEEGWKWGGNPVDSVVGDTYYFALKGIIDSLTMKEPIYFFDAQGESSIPQISTEVAHLDDTLGRAAPFNFQLKTKKNIKAGNYTIDIVFTYFNGQEWLADSKRVEFRVQNYLEANAEQIEISAYVASIVALGLAIEHVVGPKNIRRFGSWLWRTFIGWFSSLRFRLTRLFRKSRGDGEHGC